MFHEPSPFLHREEDRPQTVASFHQDARAERAARDRWMAAMTLERLRYRQWVKHGKVGAVMQALGDWGRHAEGPMRWVIIAYASLMGLFWWL